MARSPWRLTFILALAVPLFCTPDQSAREDRVETLKQAAKLIDDHDLAAAEGILQKLLAARSTDPVALNLLGYVRMQQQNTAEAEKLFQRAIEGNPLLPGAHLNLALLYANDRPEDAIAELGNALAIAPEDTDAQQALRRISAAAAAASAGAGDKEKALALMLQAHQIMPHDPELLVDTALAAMDKGLYRDGEKYLLDALRIRSNFPRATYALARAYLAQNKLLPAEEQMRKYLAACPDDATAQYGLGYILVAEQKPDAARPAFERSLALQPQQTESLFQLGEIALQEGHSEQAADRYAKVLERDPGHAGALTGMGIIAFRAGRLEEAQNRLQTAAERAPGYYKAHYYYALTLRKLGRTEEAEREFHIATNLQKRDKPTMDLAPGQ